MFLFLFLGFKVAEINGSIPVKERGGIVNDFNRVNAGKFHDKIPLLFHVKSEKA